MKVPQADDLGEVLRLPSLINGGATDLNSLAEVTNFAPRQILYYIEAAVIIGFVSRENRRLSLTTKGEEFVSSINKKVTAFEAIKNIPIIQKIIDQALLDKNGTITKKQIIDLIQKETDFALATVSRRANTLFNWFYWISHHFPDFCYCEEERVRIYCIDGKISSR